jgi:phosphoserine phosphatase
VVLPSGDWERHTVRHDVRVLNALASWQDTPTREAIVAFAQAAAERIPPEQRVAVFDNDGTLWCEKPIPIQLDFILRRFAAQAEADPALRTRQPWQAAYEHDMHWLGAAMVKHYNGDDADMKLLMGAVADAFTALSVEEYQQSAVDFLAGAEHPTLKRAYRECAYAPMIELLRFLEQAGFTNYIASGGDRDFMRPIASELYEIPPERVIGSSLLLDYRDDGQGEGLVVKQGLDMLDDGPVKPVRIWSRVGRRPALACGNSNGDVPMLRFAGVDGAPPLRLLLRHDDEAREGVAYDAGAEKALAAGFTVISMQDDWSRVFGT